LTRMFSCGARGACSRARPFPRGSTLPRARSGRERERVAAYASAVSGADEVYSPGSVPPTFAAVYCLLPSLAEVLRDPELGIELAGLIHAEQSFEWPVPVRLGDVVAASAEIAAVESKREG